MSEIKVNKLSPRSGTDITLGNSGTDFIVPSGATITVNSGGQIVNNGTSEGFGIAWQAVTTAATLTTIAGKGYPINTTSNACTVTLPSSASVGDQVQIVDYAGTFATNNITLTSSLNIEGAADDKLLTTNREGVIITYVDATQGWVASSGVNSGDQALDPTPADFLVIAGGGGGGAGQSPEGGGGGGAGGYRNSYASETSGGGGSSESGLFFGSGIVYTITIGAGGTGRTGVSIASVQGIASSISGSNITTISSTGGGAGGSQNTSDTAGVRNGGSGGGDGQGATYGVFGSGTANQGYNGGANSGATTFGGGGGGGAGAVGQTTTTASGGVGGSGLASSITGSSVTRGVGGNGNAGQPTGTPQNGTDATSNTGNGGGGAYGTTATYRGGNGGSGVVILRMLDNQYSGTTTGSPTVATGVGGTDTVLTFTGSGSYTG
jgi:hypothetical protein